MILRAVWIFFVMVLTVETLPFSNMDFRPSSVNQVDQKFNILHSNFYSPLRLPTRDFSRMISGHSSPPIRHPAVQYSDMLNQGKKKIAGFIPSRSRNPFSVFFDKYPGNIQLPTGEKVRHFGQRVRDRVKNFEKQHGRRMQHVMEILKRRIRPDKVENRRKEGILKKKALLNKHQSFGWHGNNIGVPYYTMNDDHKIVKKPGANFTLYSQSNVEIPILVPVPAIQPIATQYPVVPEVTTSVNFYQESEVPATIAGYVFPITSIATYKPDVIETTEITNSIDQDKMTTSQLLSDTLNRYTHTTVSTPISTDPVTESTILKANTIKTSFDEADGFTTEVKETTLSSKIENDIFDSLIIDQDANTEIGLRSTSLPSTDTTWQIESIEPMNTQTNFLIDLMSGIQVEPITSLVIDIESTTTEIGPNFTAYTSTSTSTDEKFASQIIDNETTIVPIISTFASTLPNHREIKLGTSEASLQPLALETTTVTSEVFGIMNTAFTSLVEDAESTSETILTFPSIISYETPVITNALSTIIDTAFDSSKIYTKMTTEMASTLPSTIPIETTSWLPPNSEKTPLFDVLFGIGYNRFPSSTDEVETTTRVYATFPSMTQTETNTMDIEKLTTVNPVHDNSSIEMEKTIEITSTLPSIISTETTTTLEEISTVTHSAYTNAVNDEEITRKIVPNTISLDTTERLQPNSERTPLFDGLFGIGYNRFPSLTDEVETTTRVYATFPFTTQTEINTMVTEKLITVNPVYDNSSIEMERTIEITSTLPSTISTETTTTLEEISTVTYSAYTNAVNDEEITTKIVPNTISLDTTSWLQPISEKTPLFDELFGIGYNRFPSLTDEVETTTRVYATFPFTTQTEINTMVTEKLITVNPVYDSFTIEMEGTIEITSTLSPILSTETITTLEEISTATHSAYTNAINDVEITTEIVSSTISPDTTSWSSPALEITTLVDILSKFGYDRLPSSIDELETTTGIDASFSSSIHTEKTTVMTERSTTVDPFFDNPTIQMEKTTEIFLDLSSTILPETTTIFEEISTATDLHFHSPIIDEEITNDVLLTVYSTVPTEPTTTPVSEIATFLDGLPNPGYNYFTGSTNAPETTTRTHSTLESTIPTETSTMLIERLMSVDLVSDKSTVDMEITTEIVSTFPSKISTKISMIFDEISTTMDPVVAYVFTSDRDTTSEIASTLPSTVFLETTLRPSPTLEVTSLVNVLSRFGYNPIPNFTDTVEETTEVYSTSSFTIASETTMTATEKLTTIESAFDNSNIVTEKTTEIVPMFPSRFSTKTTTSLEEISSDEVTTETVSMLSTTILTETTALPIYESDTIAEENFEYLEGNQVSNGVRIGRLLHENSDLVIPHVAYTAVEETDKKSLVNLIPLIIEELRQDNVSPEEEFTLSQVFRDLWPLLKAESKRKHGSLMDHKLAILLFQAGQRLSDTEGLPRDITSDNFRSKSKRDIGTNPFAKVSNLPKNIAQLLAIFPEIRAPVRFEENDDEEHKAQYDASDYNNEHYVRHDDTERFSGYNNNKGSSIYFKLDQDTKPGDKIC